MSRGAITVIVVSKGLEGILHFCLEAVQRSLGRVKSETPHKIVVVDNASEMPYVEDYYHRRGILLFRFDTPQSFAKANNLAANRCPNQYYLLLNNDVLLADDALVSMMKILKRDSNVGICGTKLLFPDGSIQHCGVVFGPYEKGPYHFCRGRSPELASHINLEYQAVTGACMLVRNQVWDRLGGLDEDYLFGLEDIDLCLKARQQGWRVMCCNEVASLHFESLTPGREKLDLPSRSLFLERWKGLYTLDG
jgi:GT2 family glycosyltransferase